MKIYFILVSIFLFLLTSCKQTYRLNERVKNAVERIDNYGIMQDDIPGLGAKVCPQWENYKVLKSVASINDLIALTDYKNPVVRCYAFYALAEQKYKNIYPLLLKHLYDTDIVNTESGCCGERKKVGDIYYEKVCPLESGSDTLITIQQIHQIDSILLFDKRINLEARAQLLRNLHPDIKYYNRIHEILIINRVPEAVLVLARYKNQNDIPLIKQCLYNESTQYFAIYGVREFPDTAFYSVLTNMFAKNWNNDRRIYFEWRILLQALAKYPTDNTVNLFKKSLENNDRFIVGDNKVCLAIALKKYPNKLFEPLINKVKDADLAGMGFDEMKCEP